MQTVWQIIGSAVPTGRQMVINRPTHTLTHKCALIACLSNHMNENQVHFAHIKDKKWTDMFLGKQVHLSIFCTLICFYWIIAHKISLYLSVRSVPARLLSPLLWSCRGPTLNIWGFPLCVYISVCVHCENALDLQMSLFVLVVYVGFSASLPG